jgi:hypothetical protein
VFTKSCLGGVQTIQQHLDYYNLEAKSNVQFITGHMPLPTGNYFKKDVSYISIIRDPVDRALSLMNFLYQNQEAKESDLENIILNVEMDNLQTRWIAGEEYVNGECTEQTFAKALENIHNKLIFTVPIEGTDTLMSLIVNHFNAKNFAYTRTRVTGTNIVNKENKYLCNKILEKNHYDKKLYEFVKIYWESWKLGNIESISNNIHPNVEYTVIGNSFYTKGELEYKNMEEILCVTDELTCIYAKAS